MNSRQQGSGHGGFTLIEILVVVAILGVLMGLVSILVGKASRQQDEFKTEQVVKTLLPLAIEKYKTDMGGRLPPMDLKGLNKSSPRFAGLTFTSGDDTNMCNEVLLVALRHPDLTSPLNEADVNTEPPFGNTDEDGWNQIPEGSDSDQAREILDSWGNPIVYIHKDQYKTPVRIRTAAGEDIEVYAAKKPNGVYYNQAGFQIISLGKDGKQDGEGGTYTRSTHIDDIFNFTLSEDE
jgi:prepilin-type N-terminal cleavage/methylation domain-containing protein